MKFSLWTQNGALNSKPVFDAFKDGVSQLGFTSIDNSYDADVAVIWSVLWSGRMSANKTVYEHFKKLNKPVIVLEVGALERNLLWRVSIDNKFFGHNTENTDERLKNLGLLIRPWRSPDKNKKILICCQNVFSQQWASMPETSLYLTTVITEIQKYTDRCIVVRPHPRFLSNIPETLKKFKNVELNIPKKIENTYDDYDFEDQLSKSWCVVNYNSNPGVISLINGVPVFAHPDSLSGKLSEFDFSKIETPKIIDRQQWLNDIVYTEWSIDEISRGIPLSRILDKLKT
jgi:hypothetical protein